MRHHSVAPDDVGGMARSLLHGICELRRQEAMLASPGVTCFEVDPQVREEQAIAAAVAALKARYFALTGDTLDLTYSEARSMLTTALDAYHAAHEALAAGDVFDASIGGTR